MRTGPFEGWAITAWVSALVASSVVVGLAWQGPSEEGIRLAVRSSVQIGLVAFSLAFSASSLRRSWKSDFTAWQLRNRRYLGVSFGVAHFVHLGALIALGVAFPDPFVGDLEATTLAGGGLAYLLLAAMVLTSFDRTAAWLGRKNWRRLHLVGSYWLCILFVLSYLPRVFFESALYAPLAALPIGVLVLRFGSWLSTRRASPAAEAQRSAS